MELIISLCRLCGGGSVHPSFSTTAVSRKDAGSESGAESAESGAGKGWISRILTGPEGGQKQSHSSLLSDTDIIYEIQSMHGKGGSMKDSPD